MIPFQQRDYDAQAHALTETARSALGAWGIPPRTLTLHTYANNAVFRAVVADGTAYGVRVYRPGKRPRTEIESEWRWVAALWAAGLAVPLSAGPVISAALDGVDDDVYVVAWRWLSGQVHEPADHTPEGVVQVGALAARIHGVALGLRDTPQEAAINRPRLDYEGLFGERSPYHSEAGAQHISQQAAEVLAEVAERVREVMAGLDTRADTFGLIHGDLIYKNTLFADDGTVWALDFDDCGYGYFLYDIAVPLLFYKPLAAYADLKAALWEGYTTVRPLPSSGRAALETLIAGRYVASCRWVAGNAAHPSLRGKAREIIDERAAELRGFLRTGVL